MDLKKLSTTGCIASAPVAPELMAPRAASASVKMLAFY
jgi:hypothetical protein